MDNLKIKFYQEAEACSWANRFKTDMTFGQLRKAVENEEFEKIDILSYSPDFDMDVPSKGFDISGMKVSSILLEDGTKIWLRPTIYDYTHDKYFLLMDSVSKIWLDDFLTPLVDLIENNATEEEKKKLFDDYNKKYRNH